MTTDGETSSYGDLIIGVSVSVSDLNREGEVCIDIRDIFKKENLVVRLQLPELLAALASATLNADHA